MEFRSRSSGSSTVPAPCGRGVSPQYEERIVNGVMSLVKTGERDVHAFIQAGKPQTLIYNILDRFSKGDISAIQRVKGYYADVSAMPKSLVEVHNFMKTLDSNFDSLPAEVKDKFGNSPHKFMESVENGEFVKILGDFVQPGSVDPNNKVVQPSQKDHPEKVKKEGDN